MKEKIISIYDYKTFPVTEKDIPDLVEKYKTQMSIYQKAVSNLFPNYTVKTFLVFTACGKIQPVN
jgi:ATP-dependent exoDNAse (exonuclease V) beta subunit